MSASVAAAESDAVALVTALAQAGGDVAEQVAREVLASAPAHRALVAFVLVERSLAFDPHRQRVAAHPVAATALRLLVEDRAGELRDLLNQGVGTGSEFEQMAFLTELAQALVTAAGDSATGELRSWGLAVASDPAGRGERRPGTRG